MENELKGEDCEQIDTAPCICSPGILLGEGLFARLVAAGFAAGANTSIAVPRRSDRNDASSVTF